MVTVRYKQEEKGGTGGIRGLRRLKKEWKCNQFQLKPRRASKIEKKKKKHKNHSSCAVRRVIRKKSNTMVRGRSC